MPEVRTPVLPISVDYVCDNCGAGHMICYESTASIPAIFKHKCDNCGDELQSKSRYPMIQYVDMPKTKDLIKKGDPGPPNNTLKLKS